MRKASGIESRIPGLLMTVLPLIALAVFLLIDGMSPAYVYKTWPGKYCVRVEPVTAGTCSHLPDRYTLVWVAPEVADE